MEYLKLSYLSTLKYLYNFIDVNVKLKGKKTIFFKMANISSSTYYNVKHGKCELLTY